MALTEREIFASLKENYRLAAENARRLGNGEGGPLYPNLRINLKFIEGGCRQAAFWRGDARWLALGAIAGRAANEAWQWVAPSKRHKMLSLAAMMENGLKASEQLQHDATGRSGLILPKVQAGPVRQNRPVQVILPDGFQRVH